MKRYFYLILTTLLISCSKSKTMHTNKPIKQSEGISYLALGDSYTKGESVDWDQNWPNQLVKTLEDEGVVFESTDIIAQTGWRTDDLKSALGVAKPKTYDLVSLLIGVNNFYQNKNIEDFEVEFEDLLKAAIKLAKGNKNKVFVLSIPDYGYTPFGKEDLTRISAGIKRYNGSCERICKVFGIKYFFITDITQQALEEPHLVANDGLHPSQTAYGRIVSRIYKEVLQIIETKP